MADDSTADNSNLVDMDDLDAFSDAFYQKPEEAEVEVVEESEEVDETEDTPLATEDEELEEEVEEETAESEDEPEPEPEPKPKKKSALQTRIDELVADAREAQRERDALQKRLDAVEAREEKVPEEPVPLREQLPPEAPNPDALDDKGEPVYTLGEFDPKFIRDLTRFTIEQETKRVREEAEEKAKAKEIADERDRLQVSWAEKVQKTEEELPDFREKVRGLTEAFVNVEPQYGEYLATTIMQCDNGPEIMYYLSQNIGEAQKIVASGPFAATLAIGRLQARLEPSPVKEEESNTQKQKVSEAPPPPESRNRGSGGKFSVAPDTNDLDAFEREFFKPRGR